MRRWLRSRSHHSQKASGSFSAVTAGAACDGASHPGIVPPKSNQIIGAIDSCTDETLALQRNREA
jgi:hypothetical protein